MKSAKITVVLSFIISFAIVFSAFSSTSSSGLTHYNAEDWFGLLCVSAFLAWPWQKAFVFASDLEGTNSAFFFSYTSVVIATLFYSPISNAPAEGVGYNIIFCMLLIWGSFLISKAIKNEK